MTKCFLGNLLSIIANLDMSSQRRKYVVYMFADAELTYETCNIMTVMHTCVCVCVDMHICI